MIKNFVISTIKDWIWYKSPNPKDIRNHIYTTNIIENFNYRIEVKRINSGRYFQSQKITDIAIYLIASNLTQNRWKKVIPTFIEAEYEINQLFNLKFNNILEKND